MGEAVKVGPAAAGCRCVIAKRDPFLAFKIPPAAVGGKRWLARL